MIKNVELLPAPVAEILTYFLQQVEERNLKVILSFNIIGSVALNDFYSGRSDIDFMASTSRALNSDEVTVLKEIHHDIAAKFTTDLSGFYMEERLYIEPEQTDITCYVCFNGNVYKGTRPSMYTMPYLHLKTVAVTLYGDMPEVNYQNGIFLEQLYTDVNINWKGWIKKHTFPGRHFWKLLLYSGLTERSVLAMGRNLYMLRTGAIISKKDIGLYLLKNYPVRYHPIIREAVASLPIGKKKIRFSIWRYRETLKMIKAIVNDFNHEFAKISH